MLACLVVLYIHHPPYNPTTTIENGEVEEEEKVTELPPDKIDSHP